MLRSPVPLHAQGVYVALVPGSAQVDPGAEFDVDLVITQAGSAFNGFDAVIGFDPAALTLVPLVPKSLQEGQLITSACDTRFHVFTPGTSSASISDALLCADTFITGPGQLYRLHFRASTTPQTTALHFLPGLQFYAAGLYVNPAYATDAQVQIGAGGVGVGAPPPGARLALDVRPNPVTSGAELVVDAPRGPPVAVRIVDARGALVRRLGGTGSQGGPGRLRWDGRDGAGRRVPAGAYVAVVEQAGRCASRLIVMLR